MGMSRSTTTARVYASALMEIAKETDSLSQVYDDLKELWKLYDGDREFRAFFTSPRIDPDEKNRIVKKALGDKIGKPVMGLLHVMVEKGREPLLDNVAREFAHYKDLAEGKVHLHVRSARKLDEDQKNEIVALVEKKSGRTVELHEHIEPDLIGGTIVRLDDFVVDGSLKRKLKALRKALLEKERLFG